MSFPLRESIDVDMWTGAGASTFACFNPQIFNCPLRGGACCIAFVEILCCPTGTHTARLLGITTFGEVGPDWALSEKHDEAAGDPWDGSYWMPYALAVSLSEALPYGWHDADGVRHTMAPASVLPVLVGALPGTLVSAGPPPVWGPTSLPITAPEDVPAGCSVSYVAISSREWIDVIQSDGVDGEGQPKYKTNCHMGCSKTDPVFH
jgi:hypothetical protein